MRSVLQRMGAEAERPAGYNGRVAGGAGDLALPGTNLQFSGHHGADAGGGTSLYHRGQELARHHEADLSRPTSYEHTRD